LYNARYASNIFDPSMDLPIAIEIVDIEEKILMFLASVEPIVGNELITLERVQAIFYRGKSS